MELTHFDENGKAIMVDISAKKDTGRTAEAEGTIFFNSDVADAICKGTSAKGDVIGVATVAGIIAAKRTWELIPMCHNIPLGSCQVIFDEKPRRIPVQIAATQDAGQRKRRLRLRPDTHQRRAIFTDMPLYRQNYGQDRGRDGSPDGGKCCPPDGLRYVQGP